MIKEHKEAHVAGAGERRAGRKRYGESGAQIP